MDLNETVFCLACRKPMPAAEALCPECGADQDAARTQRAHAGHAAKAARAGGGAAVAPPQVEARTEYVPCPNCNVPVAPERSSCGYCGHMMDDPDAQRRFEVGYSKIYVSIGVVLAILALIPKWVFPYQGFILAAAAMVMGRVAQAENRFGIAGPVVVAMGFIALAYQFIMPWILAGLSMGGG